MNHRILRLPALLLLLSLLLTPQARADRSDDLLMAERAFETILTGQTGRYTYTSAEQAARVKANTNPRFQPVLTVFDLVITPDDNDPDMIHYSCTLPGAAGVALTMLTGYFYKTMDTVCPRVAVSGTLRFTEGGMGRRLLADRRDNPFQLLLDLRYLIEKELVMPATFKVFGNYDNEEFHDVLEALTRTVAAFYGDMLGREDYYDAVVAAEMETVLQNLDLLTQKTVTAFDAIAGDYLDLEWDQKLWYDLTRNMVWRWGIAILLSLVVVPLSFLIFKQKIRKHISRPCALKEEETRARSGSDSP